jgi:uncharacterized membrane protein
MLVLFGFILGFSAGLRSMTPLAVVTWAVRIRWPWLASSVVSVLAAAPAAYVATVFAVLELIADKLPFVPSRLGAGPLAVRVLSGGGCAVVLAVAAHAAVAPSALAGAIGALAGAWTGYHVRRRLTADRRLPDLAVALAEDALAIGLAMLAVTRV